MHLHPSAKSDHYLNLCLEQAALSPLNYRHGAVVVQGGKVLGAGFNDYRPGFHGGSSSNGAVTALSMHSEMMAIHAVLGGKAAAIRAIKASRGTKQSRFTVEEYVEAVLRASLPPSSINSKKHHSPPSLTEMAEGAGWCFEGSSCGLSEAETRRQQQPAASKRSSTSFPYTDDTKSDDDCATYRSSSSRKTARSRSTSPKISPGRSPSECNVLKAKSDVQRRKRHPRLAGADLYVARLGKPGTCHRRKTPSVSGSESGATISTSGMATAAARVAVVATAKVSTGSLHNELIHKHHRSSPCAMANTTGAATKGSTDTGSDLAFTHASPITSNVVESRPCYRCISYMHVVGIKRVFWTNSDGVWEGAKVRDLVDSFEAARYGSGSNSSDTDFGGMFVTKHEVLLLLRTLAENNRRRR